MLSEPTVLTPNGLQRRRFLSGPRFSCVAPDPGTAARWYQLLQWTTQAKEERVGEFTILWYLIEPLLLFQATWVEEGVGEKRTNNWVSFRESLGLSDPCIDCNVKASSPRLMLGFILRHHLKDTQSDTLPTDYTRAKDFRPTAST